MPLNPLSRPALRAAPRTGPAPTFGPFRLFSAIDLARLRLPIADTGIAVAVNLASVVVRPDEMAVMADVTASAERCTLTLPGLARFAVTGGSQVTIDLDPTATSLAAQDDIRAYLTTWVFGVLCHQNAMLPLHASTIAMDGAATALLGPSGAGKSTLAAFLERRGHTILSDDICLLPPGPEATSILPVASWLKLARPTLDQLGLPAHEPDRTFSDEEKFRRYLAPPDAVDVRLKTLVFLDRPVTPASQPRLERLSTTAAIGAMMRNTYLAYLVEAMGIAPRVFAHCARVLENAQAYRLTAPLGWEHMDAVVTLLKSET